jgi:hypothetical protein
MTHADDRAATDEVVRRLLAGEIFVVLIGEPLCPGRMDRVGQAVYLW